MRLLAVDTSTSHLSVAVLEGRTLRAKMVRQVSGGHADCLLGAIDAVLAAAGIGKRELDCLAVCRGPGSFSGLRVGIAGLAGMAAALEKPLLSFVGLDLLALQFASCWPGIVCPVLDARRHQVYWAAYEAAAGGNGCRRLSDYRVDDPGKIFTVDRPAAILAVGSGVDAYREVMAAAGGGRLLGLPRGIADLALVPVLLREQLAALGAGEPAPPVRPLYIRPADAEINLARRQAADDGRPDSGCGGRRQ
ncbi:MAG: tRNA (adenosine(37)-N6)-threonylcarbamoyltransferase complex dimerization subunit type 1 TsaB [Deltaproteobacteria bacterium]|nr:tRNA (adenosine(37)-N6)-threonylcarbamoyltransferase complex dimerization subunit type 1 TsaB [Deltaproteobacteria bacterium]